MVLQPAVMNATASIAATIFVIFNMTASLKGARFDAAGKRYLGNRRIGGLATHRPLQVVAQDRHLRGYDSSLCDWRC